MIETFCLLEIIACVGSLHVKVMACEKSSGRLQTSKDEQIPIAQNWNSAVVWTCRSIVDNIRLKSQLFPAWIVDTIALLQVQK